MKTIIIGFMGTTGYKTLDYGDYNKQCFSTCAIFEKYRQNGTEIDKVISLGTTEAKTNSINLCNNLDLIINKNDNIIETMEKVMDYENSEFPKWSKTEIPESCKNFFEYVNVKSIENETELNETFHQILDIIKTFADQHKEEEIKLVIDVTNGFRTQPIAAIMIANLIKQKFENVKVDDLWYGVIVDTAKDTQDTKDTKKYKKGHLLSIKKQNELADWSLGFHNYIKTGDTEILKLTMSTSQSSKETTRLVKKLERFSQCLKVCRMDDVKNAFNDVNKAIEAVEVANKRTEFNLLTSMFEQIKEKFKDFKTGVVKPSIEWNFNHGNIQQAITICSEYLPVCVFQNNLLYDTKYDKSNNKNDVSKEFQDLYIFVSKVIKTKNIRDCTLEIEGNMVFLREKEKNLFYMIDKIEKDIVTVLEQHKDVTDLFNGKSLQLFNEIIFNGKADGEINSYLGNKWNELFKSDYDGKSFRFSKNDKKTRAPKWLVININSFKAIYATCVVNKLIYTDSQLNKISQKIGDNIKPMVLLDLFEQVNREEEKINFKMNIIKYKNANLEKYKFISEQILEFVNKASRIGKNDYKNILNEIESFNTKVKENSQYKVSNFLKNSKENQEEFKKVLDAYSKLRIYRNDINHAGLSFANKMEGHHQNNTHKIKDFYKEDKNEVKESLFIVSNFIGKIEEQDRD